MEKSRKGGFFLGVRHKKEKERASFSAGRTFESALSSTGSIRARYLKLPKHEIKGGKSPHDNLITQGQSNSSVERRNSTSAFFLYEKNRSLSDISSRSLKGTPTDR